MPLVSLTLFVPLLGAIVLVAMRGVEPRTAHAIGIGASGLALLGALGMWLRDTGPGFSQVEEVRWIPSLGAAYRVGIDGISLPIVVLTTVLFLVSLVYSFTITERATSYVALFLLLETASIGVFVSLDLVLFYVFWEITLVAMYFIIAGWGHEDRQRAALTFFIYTLLGSLPLLLAILALYLGSDPRTFDMRAIIADPPLSGTTAMLTLIALLVAMAVKTPVFPLHTWLPAAHVEAPTAGSVVLAGVMLKLGTYGLIRLALQMTPDAFRDVALWVAIAGVFSAIYGAFVALAQTDLKRMVAYTSVNHMGYVVVAVAAAAATTDAGTRALALDGAVLQMVSHGIVTGALFLLVGVIQERAHTREMSAFGGLLGTMPTAGWLFILGAFASLGLPALAHFPAEFQIFLGTFKVWPVLAAIVITGIVVTAGLYLRAIQATFLGAMPERWRGLLRPLPVGGLGDRAAAGADGADRCGAASRAGRRPSDGGGDRPVSGGMTMDMQRDLGLLLPEIIVILTGVAALVAGMLRRHTWAMPITVAGLLVAMVMTLPLVGDDTTAFMGTVRIDDLSIWAKLVMLPATALASVLSVPEVRGTDREATVHSLLSMATLGALALAGAGDVMFLVLGVLLTSLASFALVAYPRDDRATEAAIKYFVFGSVSGAVMLFGLTFWFGASGSTLLTDLDAMDGKALAAAVGLVAVTVGLGYKAAIAPFHFWAPDAYDGGPVAVAAYLSIVPKIGAIFAIFAVLRELPVEIVDWRLPMAFLAVLSMTYGNLAALVQTNVLRLLAYSSIAQAGYFLLAVVAIGEGDLAMQALVVFAAAYAAMNLGAFAIVQETGRDLDAFAGLGRLRPWAGAAMAVFLFSLVGIPPMAGFFGKLLLFGAAIDAGYAWLAVAGILNSVLSLAVYLRIVVPMYRTADEACRGNRLATAVWVIALVATLLIGVLAEPLAGAIGR